MAAVLVDVEEVAGEVQEVCAEPDFGNLFVTILSRSGWFSEV